MTTACTASPPKQHPSLDIGYSSIATTRTNNNSSTTTTIVLNGEHNHNHNNDEDGDVDSSCDEDDENGESQLFSPPPLAWFLHQEQQQQQQHLQQQTLVESIPLQQDNQNQKEKTSTFHTSATATTTRITTIDNNTNLVGAATSIAANHHRTVVTTTGAAVVASHGATAASSTSHRLHHQSHPFQTIIIAPSLHGTHNNNNSVRMASPQQAPSWQELSCQVLPAAAKELISTCLHRMVDTAHRGYVQAKWTRKYSDLGNNAAGFVIHHQQQQQPFLLLSSSSSTAAAELPPFSSLPWIDRQLVAEWRTFDFATKATKTATTSPTNHRPSPNDHHDDEDEYDDDDLHSFDKARALVPKPLPRPIWQCADYCFVCTKLFGPTRLRHHCRLCGNSFCQYHSTARHALPHLGYDPDIPERVCDGCKSYLLYLNHAERVAWRLARCRDLQQGQLTPYFETGVDTLEQAAWRVAKATLTMIKSFPLVSCVLGTSATVAVETLDVLRQYGIHGMYGILLRREFLAAADLLRKTLGINRTSWPLSVHELTAAIFYALAQHRAIRGLQPDLEHECHAYQPPPPPQQRTRNYASNNDKKKALDQHNQQQQQNGDIDDFPNQQQHSPPDHYPNGILYSTPALLAANLSKNPPTTTIPSSPTETLPIPVCDPVSEALLGSLLWYAPLALKFIYAEREVDMQLLAAQQGWRLLYAHLEPEQLSSSYDDNNHNNHTLSAATTTTTTPASSHLDNVGVSATASSSSSTIPSSTGAFWEAKVVSDRPATAMLVHPQAKIACLVIRGTTTIQDVVTDIRQTPIPFPTESTAQATPPPTPLSSTETNPPKENSTNNCTTKQVHLQFNNDKDDFEDWTSVCRGQGLAVSGMANAAMNLFRDHIDVLVFWAQQGYRIRITGHSLGGGVAALLGVLVLRHFEELQLSPSPSLSSPQPPTAAVAGCDSNMLLHVYAYGTPSCVDGVLSDKVKSFVTSVVLHDDVVPRLTPTSIRGLLKHLLYIRETWVKAHLPADILAITERAKTAWAPRWRGSFTLRTPSSIHRYCRKQIRKGTRKLLSVKGKLAVMSKKNGINKTSSTSTGRYKEQQNQTNPCDDLETISETSFDSIRVGIQMKQGMLQPTNIKQSNGNESSSSLDGDSLILPAEVEDEEKVGCGVAVPSSAESLAPRRMLDYLGGIDKRSNGIVIDGDEFFDAQRSLLLEEEEEEDSSIDIVEQDEGEDEVESESQGNFNIPNSLPPVNEIVITDDNWHGQQGQAANTISPYPKKIERDESRPDQAEPKVAENNNNNDRDKNQDDDDDEEGTPAVVLEELPLPRMYLPGQVVHIYSHRGVFRAAIVPRNFRDLRRISLAGNMLSDHTSQAYYNALLEVQSVRDAPEAPPRWAAFDEDDTCACCASRFTWASTSDSKAQEARDKHNCRSCGSLVCDPCSQNRIPLPSIGVIVPSRVCDRCYNDTNSPTLTQSGLFATARTTHVDLWNYSNAPVSGVYHPWSRPTKYFQSSSDTLDKPQRQRERRSAVVDELASHIPTSSSTAGNVTIPASATSVSTSTS